ncbi:hypothetical protein Q4Q39_12190 [Flavivirga amylovorans]|uniref:Uncharacterized protein n=1 Tax=Flavivirga amylovorans TaxID=870486 RepID=A0ABT8X3L9_9FLAO|nr:hypothetical protein [Flavivirga amylovorans]MDO5988165.1 hypothetical protein [Flavivirga amylovorans]
MSNIYSRYFDLLGNANKKNESCKRGTKNFTSSTSNFKNSRSHFKEE